MSHMLQQLLTMAQAGSSWHRVGDPFVRQGWEEAWVSCRFCSADCDCKRLGCLCEEKVAWGGDEDGLVQFSFLCLSGTSLCETRGSMWKSAGRWIPLLYTIQMSSVLAAEPTPKRQREGIFFREGPLQAVHGRRSSTGGSGYYVARRPGESFVSLVGHLWFPRPVPGFMASWLHGFMASWLQACAFCGRIPQRAGSQGSRGVPISILIPTVELLSPFLASWGLHE